MKCVVTGVAGFIGSHLAESLVADGLEVAGVDSFLDNYGEERKRAHLAGLLDSPAFTLVEGALQEIELGPMLDGVERVYHLAALPGVRSSWGRHFSEYLDNNVLATHRLLEACIAAGTSRFVYSSSSSVYGDTEELPMREESPTRPFSPYGVTKLAGEHLVRLYRRNFGLSVVSLRYFTVYGPRQRPDMAIQRFLKAAARGETVRLYGDGEQSRDFTYVADAVDATRRAAERGETGAVYNVGCGSRVSLNRLIGTIEDVSGQRIRVEREAPKPGDVRATHADCCLARSALGFEPRVPLDEGLGHQWAWLTSAAALTS